MCELEPSRSFIVHFRDSLQLSSYVQLDSTGTCAVYPICEEYSDSDCEDEDERELSGEIIPCDESNEFMGSGDTEQWD